MIVVRSFVEQSLLKRDLVPFAIYDLCIRVFANQSQCKKLLRMMNVREHLLSALDFFYHTFTIFIVGMRFLYYYSHTKFTIKCLSKFIAIFFSNVGFMLQSDLAIFGRIYYENVFEHSISSISMR